MPERRALRNFLLVIGLVLLYAFAVQQTQINLERPLEPSRQEQTLGVLRLLAQPDFFDTDAETGRITLSQASITTRDRIVETLLMALLASIFGTVLAVPVSFLAAKNLMENVTAPLASIMAAIITFPIGVYVGTAITEYILGYGSIVTDQAIIGVMVLLVTAVIIWFGFRMDLPEDESTSSQLLLVGRFLGLILLIIFALGLLGNLGGPVGDWLEDRLGAFSFLGYFIAINADIILILLPFPVGIITGLMTMSLGAKYGQEAVLSLPQLPARIVTGILAAGGTAVFIFGIGKALDWLYQYDNPENVTTIPAAIGAVVMLIVGLVISPKRPFAIGPAIYTVSRSILNALRAIEPLILGIVFVVWVGLGPFAGVMALSLHSIAALGKLFSEQIEGISDGPIEAIIATGANRVQMIVFAVIPQIIPPFLAFTFYRWDINVRMSTIIGFIGGGGIGFVLSQNIRQLRYSQASVMMLAIAVIVALLDYASSKIRSRII